MQISAPVHRLEVNVHRRLETRSTKTHVRLNKIACSVQYLPQESASHKRRYMSRRQAFLLRPNNLAASTSTVKVPGVAVAYCTSEAAVALKCSPSQILQSMQRLVVRDAWY